MFLNSFNHFRAIAIIFIVAGHCRGVAGLQFTYFFEKVVANLITGGTILFVFISGFLFHYVYYRKYQYKKFIYTKVKRVLVPYLVLGAVPIMFYVGMKKDVWSGYFLPQDIGLFSEYVMPTLKYYWTGRFLMAYWYIPFIFITFLLSPLHVAFIKSKLSVQVFTIALLFFISIFMHRPVDSLHVFQSVVYFSPVYLLGIFFSVHSKAAYKVLAGKELFLLAIVVLLAIVESYQGKVGSYHKPPFEYASIDLLFIQKIFLSIFFMIFLARYEKYNNRIIHLLAATSFTIFFLHPFLIWLIHRTVIDYLALDSWLVYFISVFAITSVCMLIALSVRRITPRFSRLLIGY